MNLNTNIKTGEAIREAFHSLENLLKDRVIGENDKATKLISILTSLHYHGLQIQTDQLDYSADAVVVETPSYDHRRQIICQCFPASFGLYTYHLDSECKGRPEDIMLTGDAIDDLADIYAEFYKGSALWDMGYRDNALLRWRTTYEVEWGPHLVNLLFYLHNRSEHI